MKLQTKYLGEIDVDQDKILQFSSGLPGFIDEKQFVLLEMPGNPIFQVLQSVQTPDIAFIVVSPYQFYQDYVIDSDDRSATSLDISHASDVIVLTIVTVKQPLEASTLNLKAPVIINSQNNKGEQYILTTDAYPSQTAIMASDSTTVKGD